MIVLGTERRSEIKSKSLGLLTVLGIETPRHHTHQIILLATKEKVLGTERRTEILEISDSSSKIK